MPTVEHILSAVADPVRSAVVEPILSATVEPILSSVIESAQASESAQPSAVVKSVLGVESAAPCFCAAAASFMNLYFPSYILSRRVV